MDRIIDDIRNMIRQYERDIITPAELVNGVFLRLGESERFDLAGEVFGLIPLAARGELWRVVESAHVPESTYFPFVIGRDPCEERRKAWEQRMGRACRQLAALFQKYSAPGG